jgi:hypothetical protein
VNIFCLKQLKNLNSKNLFLTLLKKHLLFEKYRRIVRGFAITRINEQQNAFLPTTHCRQHRHAEKPWRAVMRVAVTASV